MGRSRQRRAFKLPCIMIRYDMRCCFNVRWKADISQLNLPHGTKTKKWKTEKLKSKKTDMLRSIGKQSEESVESVLKKKREATVGRICSEWKVLSPEWKTEGVMDDETGEPWSRWRKCRPKGPGGFFNQRWLCCAFLAPFECLFYYRVLRCLEKINNWLKGWMVREA